MLNKEITDHSFILKNIVCYVSVFVGKGLVVSSSIIALVKIMSWLQLFEVYMSDICRLFRPKQHSG